MGSLAFWTGSLMFMVAAGLVARLGLPDFYIMMFGAVLQLMILGTAWNILAGYCGYSNFGASAFVGIGAYSSAFLAKALGSLLALQILAGAAAGALLGLMIGLMTIRLRGIHFAIGTLALSVILETCVNNWDYMGGSRGMAIPPPVYHSLFGDYIRILLIVSSALLVAAVGIARFIHTSWIGRDSGHSRRRACSPVVRRSDARPQAAGDLRLGRPDGRCGQHRAAVHGLRRSRHAVQSRLCAPSRGGGANRRNRALGRPVDRRRAVRRIQADSGGIHQL